MIGTTILGPPALAFVIATFLALLELVTSKYPQTFFLLRKSPAIYGYALIYGVMAFGVTLGIGALIKAGSIKLQGIGLANVWVQVAAIGISFKALLHIRLFSVGLGSESFPVGIETLVQLFEPWLLRMVELKEFYAVRSHIAPRAQKYQDLNEVKRKIRENIPTSWERTGLLADVQRANTVTKALHLYLTYLGRKALDQVFPLH